MHRNKSRGGRSTGFGEGFSDFVACYNPGNRHRRTPTWSEATPDGRWRRFTYDELMARDKVNLDVVWIRGESLEETALEQFRAIAEDLR